MPLINAIYQWLDIRRLGFVILFLALLTGITLVDPDYFWHLRTGQYIVDARALPTGDPYSFTAYGKPWVLHEWLFEVLLYGAYAALGAFGVKLLCAGFGIATLAVGYGTARRILGNATYSYLLALTYFMVVAFGISPRPQLTTYLFLAIYLRVLVGYKYAGATSALWLLPAVMLVWVNCHAGYVAGIALVGLFCVCEWIVHLLAEPNDPEQKPRLRRLALVLAITVLATLVNPYFIHHWSYPFYAMSMEAAKTYISEWQSPNFHQLRPLSYLALVIASFVIAMYRARRPDLTEVAVTSLFVAAGFIGVRHIPVAALVLLPFAAASLAQVPLADAPGRLGRILKSVAGPRTKRRTIGRVQFLINWLLLALLAGGSLLYYPLRHADDAAVANKYVPVKATAFIRQAGLAGRMFNSYHFGGYLIEHLYPSQRVFIDGRVDMYGDDLLKDYMEIVWGGANWQPLFDKYRIDYLVIERRLPLRQLLICRGDYKLVYDDADASVLVKDVARYAQVISRYAPAYADGTGARCALRSAMPEARLPAPAH